MSEDEAVNVDEVRKKVLLTLIGESYSLINATPSERLEASLMDGLYALVTAQAQPDRIMELTDWLLRFKRKEGAGASRRVDGAIRRPAHRRTATLHCAPLVLPYRFRGMVRYSADFRELAGTAG